MVAQSIPAGSYLVCVQYTDSVYRSPNLHSLYAGLGRSCYFFVFLFSDSGSVHKPARSSSWHGRFGFPPSSDFGDGTQDSGSGESRLPVRGQFNVYA